MKLRLQEIDKKGNQSPHSPWLILLRLIENVNSDKTQFNWISLVWNICWNQQWHWHWMWSVIHTIKAKWFIFKSTNFCSVTDAVEKFYIVESFYFILIELCISMRIFVWTGSSQCFMTQCTTETACLTPGVTMQGYKSQKCEISINHNLTRPAKQWIARQIIGILTRTKHGSHATISDQCLLPDHLLSRDPLVTQVWPGNLCPLPPLLIITNPWPGDHWVISREEVKLPAAMLSQVTPDWLSESMNGHLTISSHPEPGHSWA